MLPLPQLVRDPRRRPAIVRDVVQLIDSQVASKRGVGGLALRGGYRVVSKLKGGRMVPAAAEMLLDEFAVAIEPLRAEWERGESGSFSAFLQANERRAAEALLGITDRRAERSTNRVLVGTYRKLRPTALQHVQEALPALGGLIETYRRGPEAG